MLEAAKYGIVEFIIEMTRVSPDLLWVVDEDSRGIFSHATLCRREQIFNYIFQLKGSRQVVTSHIDAFDNNMLHLAGMLAPSSELDRRSGAALQMQRELQWFKSNPLTTKRHLVYEQLVHEHEIRLGRGLDPALESQFGSQIGLSQWQLIFSALSQWWLGHPVLAVAVTGKWFAGSTGGFEVSFGFICSCYGCDAVQSIVPRKCKEALNIDGKKPREVFSRNHEDLLKGGEKWAKETASSFTIVGTLIITIMFSAAFTVPGGSDQNTGVPFYINRGIFTVFVISDALSLCASSTSVLMFLGILTSRYAEEDFLKVLPAKLLIGLSTLFFSVVTMMISFCAAVSMMVGGELQIVVVAVVFSSIPVITFVPLHLTLFAEIFNSTVRSEILHRKTN
uniref:PGG domain-containing protein n=1 Tax=Fagus sylvatica TaxID=28930 RepID=A0A2N9EXX2_FAGSY